MLFKVSIKFVASREKIISFSSGSSHAANRLHTLQSSILSACVVMSLMWCGGGGGGSS